MLPLKKQKKDFVEVFTPRRGFIVLRLEGAHIDKNDIIVNTLL